MIHYIKKDIPAKSIDEYSHTTCDKCGGDAYNSTCEANLQETTIEYKKLFCSDGYTEGTVLTVDLCVKCFEELLIPWFKENGITPIIKEICE